MKSVTLRVASLCVMTVITLVLSHAVAKAQCENIIVGGNVWGDWECRLFAQCNGMCYYHCKCTGMTAQQCNEALDEAGFEQVQGAPC